MNSFLNNLTNETNFNRTQNGALAHKSTRSMVYDMFALGGAYRQRSDEDCILLFKNALEENESLAMKCLFYLADCRGGQGERRFFRVCFNWLANERTEVARRNLELIPTYRRWDDVFYSTMGTPIEEDALYFIKKQLALDIECKTPSLLAKWLPSENASSKQTKKAAGLIRTYLGMTHREYRKTLSVLRARINVLERLMSANRWDEIEFDKIPSKAGLIYKNAFARRDIIAKKYENFAKDNTTKVNAQTLYPYEVVKKARGCRRYGDGAETDRLMIEKYWNNLPDYFNGNKSNILCVVDTSASMTWAGGNIAPIDVACSLGMYAAERSGGPFKDHYISFSSRPQLIKFEGIDFVDKVERCYRTNLCENTNIEATFELLKKIALQPTTKPEDIPETIVIISDMQIDSMSGSRWDNGYGHVWTQESSATEMERIRADWEAHGLKCPKLVYWNVNASNNTILDNGPDVSFVSGCSPVIFEQVLKGVTGYDLMLDKLMSERYAEVE
mgnify:CR=1 FL=1